MLIDPIIFLKEVMLIRNIDVHLLCHPYEGIVHFDRELRKRLYGNYNYNNHSKLIDEYCRNNAVYLATDQFKMNYIIFSFAKNQIIIIGPYISQAHDKLFKAVSAELQFPSSRLNELKEFYHNIPYVDAIDRFETEVFVLIKYILETEKYSIERISMISDETEVEAIQEDYEDVLPLAIIENRYENEDALLEAIGKGDLKQAVIHINAFGKFSIEQRHDDSLRNIKNYCLVLKTLIRKTVQNSAVHPAHIHKVSNLFAVRIENAVSQDELKKIITEMLRKYCLLVREHSLQKYSLPVRKAVNYIDFNYTEHLGLDQLAEIASVNYSYLSSQFKKETALTVVDYINKKRMEKALKLLTTTKLSISAIAGKCAFENDSYFSRTFKKLYGKSPRDYRKDLLDVK